MKACLHFAPMIGARAGELTAGEAKALEAHLSGCAACRGFARSVAATDGLVGEALLARANERDFAPFVDEVMTKVGAHPSTSPALSPSTPGLLRSPYAQGRRSRRAQGERGWWSWLRRHRRGAIATLAPALAALAVIVYVRLGSGRGEIAMLEISSEGEATTILETRDGPVVLLSEENGS